MRSFKKFPLGPDMLSFLAVVALVTVVYLCSLPEAFHSLEHRKANAAELMAQARELIVKEGALFTSLVRAGDEKAAGKLRQALIDNERNFHDVASDFDSELPEGKADIEMLVNQFDHLAGIGWQAAVIAKQTPSDAKDGLLDNSFTNALEELRSTSDHIVRNLQKHDVSFRQHSLSLDHTVVSTL